MLFVHEAVEDGRVRTDVPTEEDATVLAAELHLAERDGCDVVPAVYRPLRLPGMHDSLGVVARRHLAAQDVDFERRLLLRALLTALPPGVCKLPPACLTLDDLDLAPVKVQAVLEALTARRRIDLGDPEFRWDLGGQAVALAMGGGPWGADEHGSPAFGGMSKRQLELASFEVLLQARAAAVAKDDDPYVSHGGQLSAAGARRGPRARHDG